ncbi:MAG: DUF493 family protein [Chitinophagaceae bacterium]|nr:DUF493 family protein [Chitinophagaceae bacterium]
MNTVNTEPQEFWMKFKTELENNFTFPTEYTYKFILPADTTKLKQLTTIFDGMKVIFSYRESSTGKYTSITIAAYHADADEIIECYKQAVLIEGIKSL